MNLRLFGDINHFVLNVSCLLPMGLILLYSIRPDWATALTVFPSWVWLVFSIIYIRKLHLLSCKMWFLLWSLFIFLHVEEISVFRVFRDISNPKTISIVSVNASSSIESIQPFINKSTDIILLQESPSKVKLASMLASHPEYQMLYGVDTSLITRGKISLIEKDNYYTFGVVSINKVDYQVVSLRLKTSNPRFDLWNIDCWLSQQKIRQFQRKQLTKINSKLNYSLPTIIGGDFNVPQQDKIFSLLEDRLHDSFTQCGVGLGNTILSDLPVLRVDQIWLSKQLKCVNGLTQTIASSDHRAYSVQIKE